MKVTYITDYSPMDISELLVFAKISEDEGILCHMAKDSESYFITYPQEGPIRFKRCTTEAGVLLWELTLAYPETASPVKIYTERLNSSLLHGMSDGDNAMSVFSYDSYQDMGDMRNEVLYVPSYIPDEAKVQVIYYCSGQYLTLYGPDYVWFTTHTLMSKSDEAW